MTAYLIKNVSVVGGAPTDLLIRDGVVAGTGTGLDAPDAAVVDGTGLVALPGLVDLHTHLREPGREDAETVESGSRAAALGGYTAVCAMANTSPVADTAGVVEQVWRLGRQAGLVDVQPIGAVTVGLAGERLAELGAMADSPARVRIFSDDGHCVADPKLMRRALEYVKAFDGIIAQHAEEPRLTEGAQMHEGEVSTRLGLTGWPAVAEEAIIARDVLLAEHVGSRLHVCHVSTAGSVEVLRQAKRRGIRVTAEVTPHHLLLTDEVVGGRGTLASPALADGWSPTASYDPVFKVNPPLRTGVDVAALRAALAEGVIDVVATDHAPHAVEDKECEWAYARPGMLGLETALSIVLDVLGPRWDLIADRMSRIPARIAGLDGHGLDPAPGVPANLTLVDPAARRVIEPTELASRSRNTPYARMTLPGRIVATFLRGEPTVLDGKAVK
ncbi:dihydroorotase [Micromonospora rifamycinica]|uniref:Dihydroorotase n=1 Tax=Micromonospora rifamycinica TaxID=291594 RepID=A0A120F8F2_9ACTN|nr:dihydroorotase [Micromonospora rifamycinica]KWV31729.1 dihydroorotase [Micromonospora rifamycinica]SCG81454.1 dihydroorotase [Micromonospora rifamycinica]